MDTHERRRGNRGITKLVHAVRNGLIENTVPNLPAIPFPPDLEQSRSNIRVCGICSYRGQRGRFEVDET